MSVVKFYENYALVELNLRKATCEKSHRKIRIVLTINYDESIQNYHFLIHIVANETEL